MVEFVEVSSLPENEDFVSLTMLESGWVVTVNVTQRGQTATVGIRSPVYEHFAKRVEAESAARSQAERAGIATVFVVLRPAQSDAFTKELGG